MNYGITPRKGKRLAGTLQFEIGVEAAKAAELLAALTGEEYEIHDLRTHEGPIAYANPQHLRFDGDDQEIVFGGDEEHDTKNISVYLFNSAVKFLNLSRYFMFGAKQ
jgi:hypothetical protein